MYCLCAIPFSLSSNIISESPTVKLCKIESRTTSKFHDYPTVNESEIVVLQGQFWVSVGKGKVAIERGFLSDPKYFQNSQWWECLELSCEPGVQISRWSNGEWVRDHPFSETGWWYAEKREDFERRTRENEIEIKKRHCMKTDVFIARVLTTYHLLYLFIFIIL